MLVIMAGLPGTGKSTLARELARCLSGAVLDKDIIRAALFEPGLVEYSAGQDDFCQEIMLQTAAYLFGRNASLHIFLDGRTLSRRYQRERAIAFCLGRQIPWSMLECVCAEATALLRLEQAAGSHPAANRTPKLYCQLRDTWEPIGNDKLVIDTDANLELCAERALGYIRSRGGA